MFGHRVKNIIHLFCFSFLIVGFLGAAVGDTDGFAAQRNMGFGIDPDLLRGNPALRDAQRKIEIMQKIEERAKSLAVIGMGKGMFEHLPNSKKYKQDKGVFEDSAVKGFRDRLDVLETSRSKLPDLEKTEAYLNKLKDDEKRIEEEIKKVVTRNSIDELKKARDDFVKGSEQQAVDGQQRGGQPLARQRGDLQAFLDHAKEEVYGKVDRALRDGKRYGTEEKLTKAADGTVFEIHSRWDKLSKDLKTAQQKYDGEKVKGDPGKEVLTYSREELKQKEDALVADVKKFIEDHKESEKDRALEKMKKGKKDEDDEMEYELYSKLYKTVNNMGTPLAVFSDAIGRGLSDDKDFHVDLSGNPATGFLTAFGSSAVERAVKPLGMKIETGFTSVFEKMGKSIARSWYYMTRGTSIIIDTKDITAWNRGISVMTNSLMTLSRDFAKDEIGYRGHSKRVLGEGAEDEEAEILKDANWVEQIPLYSGTLESVLNGIEGLKVFYKKDSQICFNADLLYKAVKMLQDHIDGKPTFREISAVPSQRHIKALQSHISRFSDKLTDLVNIQKGNGKAVSHAANHGAYDRGYGGGYGAGGYDL
jgi:hypothetical protein